MSSEKGNMGCKRAWSWKLAPYVRHTTIPYAQSTVPPATDQVLSSIPAASPAPYVDHESECTPYVIRPHQEWPPPKNVGRRTDTKTDSPPRPKHRREKDSGILLVQIDNTATSIHLSRLPRHIPQPIAQKWRTETTRSAVNH